MLNKCLSGKRGYWLGFVASFGLVALALWIQTRYQLNPCPLCISQRMVFMGLGLLFLLGAFLPAKAIWQKTVTALLVLTALGGTERVLRQIKPALASHVIVTDVGSAKASVIEAARAVFDEVPANFVPGHPIAGTEQSGVEASFAELFQNRRVVLTPLAHTSMDGLKQVRAMWEQAGAEVMEMDAARHDAVLAATSHLPHLLAYTLVDTLARMETHDDIFRFAAGGFRDFTRIAASDPVMWRDICLANRDAILAVLDHFSADLGQLRSAISADDGARILEVFTRAKRERDQFNG